MAEQESTGWMKSRASALSWDGGAVAARLLP